MGLVSQGQGRGIVKREALPPLPSSANAIARIEERERQAQECERLKREWADRVDTFYVTNPPPGAVIHAHPPPSGPAIKITIVEDLKRKGYFACYALLVKLPVEYPDEPQWTLAVDGRFGLRLFLNGPGRDDIERNFPAEVEAVCEYGHSQSVQINGAKVAVRILAYSRSGASAHVELIPKPKETA